MQRRKIRVCCYKVPTPGFPEVMCSDPDFPFLWPLSFTSDPNFEDDCQPTVFHLSHHIWVFFRPKKWGEQMSDHLTTIKLKVEGFSSKTKFQNISSCVKKALTNIAALIQKC